MVAVDTTRQHHRDKWVGAWRREQFKAAFQSQRKSNIMPLLQISNLILCRCLVILYTDTWSTTLVKKWLSLQSGMEVLLVRISQLYTTLLDMKAAIKTATNHEFSELFHQINPPRGAAEKVGSLLRVPFFQKPTISTCYEGHVLAQKTLGRHFFTQMIVG